MSQLLQLPILIEQAYNPCWNSLGSQWFSYYTLSLYSLIKHKLNKEPTNKPIIYLLNMNKILVTVYIRLFFLIIFLFGWPTLSTFKTFFQLKHLQTVDVLSQFYAIISCKQRSFNLSRQLIPNVVDNYWHFTKLLWTNSNL